MQHVMMHAASTLDACIRPVPSTHAISVMQHAMMHAAGTLDVYTCKHAASTLDACGNACDRCLNACGQYPRCVR